MKSKSNDSILVVDDEESNASMLRVALEKDGRTVQIAANGEDALSLFRLSRPSLVITDVRMPGMSGVELLEKIRQDDQTVPVMVVSGFAEVDSAVKCMQLGALDFLTKPLDLKRLRAAVAGALGSSSTDSGETQLEPDREGLESIIGHSQAIHAVTAMIKKAAPYDISVLITGESGTGKEVAAEAIHHLSPRKSGPLVTLDCTALPEHLVESELFGYEKGAFTGATERKPGRFEMANGGTLFLDEIGNLPLSVQMKLLRVLQQRQVSRLGSKTTIEIDIRLITATNSDLRVMIKEGTFREDLFHRINEIEVSLPALREREDDVIDLAKFFLRRYTNEFGREIEGFSDAAFNAIRHYRWSGNIRELQNVVKRAVILSTKRIELHHLPLELQRVSEVDTEEAQRDSTAIVVGEAMASLKEITGGVVSDIEKDIIVRTLEKTHWNKAEAARWLKVDYKTLHNKLKEYGIG